MTECSLFSTQVSFNTLSNSQTMNTIILRLSSLCKFSLLCNLLGKIFKQQEQQQQQNKPFWSLYFVPLLSKYANQVV